MSDEDKEATGSASEAAEQIGPLVFVPSADYPYPFEVEKPPRFWMEEQTGALAAAIEVYMRTEDLKLAELDLIKLYLRQYIERAVISSDANRKLLLQEVDKLQKVSDVERFADELSEAGIEPF
jgi:hypothetical protein